MVFPTHIKTTVILSFTALSLAGCDAAKEGFDDSFKQSFLTEAKKSCVEEASKSGAPADITMPFCECFAEKSYATLDKSELVNMPEDKLKIIANACYAETGGNSQSPAAK